VTGRGWALALSAVGISAAAFAVPQVASRAVEALGWRGAVLAIGLGAAAIAAPLIAMLARKRPEELGQHPDGLPPIAHDPAKLVEIPVGKLLRDPNFWRVGLGISFAFCASIPSFYLVRYMESELGMSAIEAASVPSLMAVGGLAGKLAAGWAIDRFDKRAVVLTSLALHALGWGLALMPSSLPGMLLAAVPMGMGGGSFLPLAPMLQGACFGRAMIGRVAGIHALLGMPFLLGIAPAVGWLQHRTGSFTAPFLGLAVVCALAGLVLAFTRIPKTEPGT
jgi:cyanate permease